MDAAHVPGCNTNHTRRQQCNGPVAEQQRRQSKIAHREQPVRTRARLFWLNQWPRLPKSWRAFAQVLVNDERMVFLNGPGLVSPWSINRHDVLAAERTGIRSVNIRYTDRSLFGPHRMRLRQLTMRDGEEADALASALQQPALDR